MCYARRQRSSWARIKLSINCIKITLPCVPILRAFFLSFFYFCLSSILLRISNEIFFISHYTSLLFTKVRFVLLISLVVQFSMTNSAAYHSYIQNGYSLVIISQSHQPCQVLFSSFWNFFRTRLSLPRSRPCYITTSLSLCQDLF